MNVLPAIALALTAALAACASPRDRHNASAGATQQAADAAERRFAELDANRDGRLSLSEVALDDEVEPRFELADTDHDGKLSQAEFQALFLRLSVAGTSQLPAR